MLGRQVAGFSAIRQQPGDDLTSIPLGKFQEVTVRSVGLRPTLPPTPRSVTLYPSITDSKIRY